MISMSVNESRVPLLSDDQLDIWDLGEIDCRNTVKWNSDSEGSSSGYDSSYDGSGSDSELDDDVFDSEFSSDDISDDETDDEENEDQYLTEENQSEVMNFTSTNALCNQLKYILSVPDLCDVVFHVGSEKIPIYGLKAIMGTRSRILYSLILNAEREMEEKSSKKKIKTDKKKKNSTRHLMIEVNKYEPEIFRKIIQFVHCGSVEVDSSSVTGVLCGAVQFGLEDLESACWDFLDRDLDRQSINNIMITTQNYTQHKITTKIILKVQEKLETKYKTVSKRETTV